MHARIREQTLKQQDVPDDWKDLFKSWILQSVKYVLYNDIDLNFIICMVMLQAICEHVSLSMTEANIGIDIHSFIDASIFWALTELQTLHPDMLAEHVMSESQVDSDSTYDKRNLLLCSTNLVDYTILRKFKIDSSGAPSIGNIIVASDEISVYMTTFNLRKC
jgi:hypothetical protein